MTNTDTKNVRDTVKQILALEEAGCDIVRCAVYDEECAGVIPKIKAKIHIPLAGDVHFDYKIAVKAIENGVDKIRINPGNIGGQPEILKVVSAAKKHNVPIRVGANAGSLSRELMQRHGGPTAEALVQSAMDNIRVLERAGFQDIVVSIKSSSAPVCITAYRMIARMVDYPLHLGVT
jgi:(E)-4-hydroxy-3-methylbut-2-enyl-diphosphate synthase